MKVLEAVLSGSISNQWKDMKVGAIVHSRWTNTQSSALRLYISIEEPSFELQRIVHFIVFVYAPVFLAAKHFNKAEEGPKLLLQEINAVKLHCTEEEADVAKSSIQQNGFYAHHENILFTLLSSEASSDREYAVNVIEEIRSKKAKKNNQKKKKVRTFKVPEINFNATSLYDLTTSSLSSAESEPPVTLKMTDKELKEIIEKPLCLNLPCSTVAVERGVKITSAATKVSSNPVLQDGYSFMTKSAINKNNIAQRNTKKFNVD